MAVTMGRPVGNKHRVPKKQWNKWNELARRMFNRMYETLDPKRQWVFHHPNAALLPDAHWSTVRWNVAWEAATAAMNDKLTAKGLR